MKKIIFLLGLGILVLTGCDEQTPETIAPSSGRPALVIEAEYTHTAFLIFGPIQITIYGVDCNQENGSYVDERCYLLHEAFERILDMERRWTVNDVGGEVERINEMAGIEPVEVQADTFYLIEQAIHYSIYSDAAFNIAIGPLTRLWNIAMPGSRRPADQEIEAVLPLLDPTRITLDAEASTVFLEDIGMRLDLGGIAKGFMPDLVAEFFLENDIEHALMIVGGEVVALNGRPNGNFFRIGIRNPFLDEDSPGDHHLVGTLPIFDQALITSGTYERYLAHQESQTFYHHLFDSRTGFPFETDIVSLTIIADTGLLGEVYTKIIFALGIEEGLAYVEAHAGIEALFISDDNGIYLSSGLKDVFDFLLPDEFEIRTP